MAKCNHLNIKLNIVIERLLNAMVCDGMHYEHQITRDAPVALYVEALCPDCGHHGQYNAYNGAYCRERNRNGAQAASHWPRWLKERLVLLRTTSDALQEACLACGVVSGGVAEG